MSEREQARIAVGDIQAGGENNVDSGKDRGVQKILIADKKGKKRKTYQNREPDFQIAAAGDEIVKGHGYTARIFLPRIPWGRMMSTITSTMKATMSR